MQVGELVAEVKLYKGVLDDKNLAKRRKQLVAQQQRAEEDRLQQLEDGYDDAGAIREHEEQLM